MAKLETQAVRVIRSGDARPERREGASHVDVGLEAPSGEDTSDLARVIADVPIAIEMLLKLQRHRPPVVLVTLGKGDATGSQCRFGAEFAGISVRW